MSRNGSGTYTLPAGNPVTTGTTISSTWANNTLSDIATALTQSIAKDGQTVPTANLPMGGYKLTGLGAGAANGESVRYEQLEKVYSDLSASTGAGMVGTQGAGTGAVPRTVNLKIGEIHVSPEDYGAAGDGSDDGTALQNAWNAAADEGRVFQLNAKTYGTSIRLRPPQSGSSGLYTHMRGQRGMNAGGATVFSTLKWVGSANSADGLIGWDASELGTLAQSTFENMILDANGLIGHVFLFEPTSTSTGAVRRENENNTFRKLYMMGATRAHVMFGLWSINSGADALVDDINIDMNEFDHCTFVNFSNVAYKQTHNNVYSTRFKKCFFWSGNDATLSPNAKNYLHVVNGGKPFADDSYFGPIANTGLNDGTDRVAIVRASNCSVRMINCQTEEARVLNNDTYGDPGVKHVIDGITVNDSKAGNIGCYAIYNQSSSPVTVDDSTLGALASGTDYYRNLYSAGPVHWNNSRLSKTTAGKFQLDVPRQCTINGGPITDSDFLNPNFSLEHWSGMTAAAATSNDYACNGFVKTLSGAQATLAQSTTAAENGHYTAQIITTSYTSGTGTIFRPSATLDAYQHRGKQVLCVVTGQTDGTYSSSNLGVVISSDSGNNGGSIFIDSGNYFVAYAYRDIKNTDTYVTAQLQIAKTGTVYVDTFAILPFNYDFSALYAISRYAAAVVDRGRSVQYDDVLLSNDNTGASQTFTDALGSRGNCMYLVAANHNDSTSCTAIVLATNVGGTATASVLGTAGTAGLVSVSAAGNTVTITVNGTSKAQVRKISI